MRVLREICPRCQTRTGVWLGVRYECHACGLEFSTEATEGPDDADAADNAADD